MVTKPDDAEVLEISWETVHTLCKVLAHELFRTPMKNCKYILPIPRGGLIPAIIISHITEIPLFPGSIELAPAKEHILVIDDICDTGKTFSDLKRTRPFWFYIAPIVKLKGVPYCDLYTMRVSQDLWIKYPWETIG